MLHQVHYIFAIYLHSSQLYMALIKIKLLFYQFQQLKITISSIQCIFMQNICIASMYLFENQYWQYVYLENWNRYYAYCKKQKIGIGCIYIQKIGIDSIFMQKIGISSIFMQKIEIGIILCRKLILVIYLFENLQKQFVHIKYYRPTGISVLLCLVKRL